MTYTQALKYSSVEMKRQRRIQLAIVDEVRRHHHYHLHNVTHMHESWHMQMSHVTLHIVIRTHIYICTYVHIYNVCIYMYTIYIYTYVHIYIYTSHITNHDSFCILHTECHWRKELAVLGQGSNFALGLPRRNIVRVHHDGVSKTIVVQRPEPFKYSCFGWSWQQGGLKIQFVYIYICIYICICIYTYIHIYMYTNRNI